MNLLAKSTIAVLLISVALSHFERSFAKYSFAKRETGCPGDTMITKYIRHGLLYIDKKIRNKVITRFIYEGEKLLFRYPLTKEGFSTIRLLSGNKFLYQGIDDTLQFSSYLLPPLTRLTYITGGQMTRLNDSTYLVKTNSRVGGTSKIVLTASDNFEGLKNGIGSITDSLVLPIKKKDDGIPPMLLGNFEDDYGIHYNIMDSVWKQVPNVRYHIISWNAAEQYLLVRNDDKNPSEAGLYSRIDYMVFSNMEPFLWGFCLTVYDAKTIDEAKTKAKADRGNPMKGCGGFPFSRMKRINN